MRQMLRICTLIPNTNESPKIHASCMCEQPPPPSSLRRIFVTGVLEKGALKYLLKTRIMRGQSVAGSHGVLEFPGQLTEIS